MKHNEIFARGFDSGYAAAEYCENPPLDPDVDPVDALIEAASEAETGSRDFSPFEHTASALNKRNDSEEAWETYEQGVSSGIACGVKDRLGGQS